MKTRDIFILCATIAACFYFLTTCSNIENQKWIEYYHAKESAK